MESLSLSFNAIAPIFLMMLLGYTLKQLKMADKPAFDAMNRLIFKIFLPLNVFHNIYTTRLEQVINPGLILFTAVGILLIFAVGYFAVLGLSAEDSRRGVMLQGFFRSNFAILGIPIIDYLCGDNAVGLAYLMTAVVVPIFNILAVICLERFRGGKLKPAKLLKGIVTNPLVIACAVGMVFLTLQIPLPGVVEKAVVSLGGISTPLAMVVLGASFTFSSVRGYLRETMITVAVKLVIAPLVMVTAAILLGFRGEALACVLITFGAPVAVSSFAMAQQMGGDEHLSAQVVVFSSVFCLLTLFCWIFGLSYLQFL